MLIDNEDHQCISIGNLDYCRHWGFLMYTNYWRPWSCLNLPNMNWSSVPYRAKKVHIQSTKNKRIFPNIFVRDSPPPPPTARASRCLRVQEFWFALVSLRVSAFVTWLAAVAGVSGHVHNYLLGHSTTGLVYLSVAKLHFLAIFL